MPVYMIRAGEFGPVKIGFSKNAMHRLGQIQISHWETLRLIRLLDGTPADEFRLHAMFDDLYIRGEWFHFSKILLADVGLTDIPIVEQVSPDLPVAADSVLDVKLIEDASKYAEYLRALRRSSGLTQAEVAAKVGISRSSIAGIESGGDLPGRALLMRIAWFYGKSLDLSQDVQ